eukprot:scaffold22788_cov122-Amphora_coffeaeformis.AAC.1
MAIVMGQIELLHTASSQCNAGVRDCNMTKTKLVRRSFPPRTKNKPHDHRNNNNTSSEPSFSLSLGHAPSGPPCLLGRQSLEAALVGSQVRAT